MRFCVHSSFDSFISLLDIENRKMKNPTFHSWHHYNFIIDDDDIATDEIFINEFHSFMMGWIADGFEKFFEEKGLKYGRNVFISLYEKKGESQ